VALAHHCPNLFVLRIRFRVTSLSALPAISVVGSTALQREGGLTELRVGEIPAPKQSVLAIALTLVRIFPRLACISSVDTNWQAVMDTINLSRNIVDLTSKQRPLPMSRSAFPASGVWAHPSHSRASRSPPPSPPRTRGLTFPRGMYFSRMVRVLVRLL